MNGSEQTRFVSFVLAVASHWCHSVAKQNFRLLDKQFFRSPEIWNTGIYPYLKKKPLGSNKISSIIEKFTVENWKQKVDWLCLNNFSATILKLPKVYFRETAKRLKQFSKTCWKWGFLLEFRKNIEYSKLEICKKILQFINFNSVELDAW